MEGTYHLMIHMLAVGSCYRDSDHFEFVLCLSSCMDSLPVEDASRIISSQLDGPSRTKTRDY